MPGACPHLSTRQVKYLLVVLALLSLHHGLLLLLQSLKTRGQTAHLLIGIVLIGLIVLLQLGQKLRIISSLTQIPHGERTGKERNEIIIIQSATAVSALLV